MIFESAENLLTMNKYTTTLTFVLLILFFVSLTFGQTARASSVEQLNNAQKLLQGGETDKAIVILNAELARDPKNIAAYFLRGAVNSLRGDFKSAIEDYNLVIKAAPNVPEVEQAYNNRGVIRYRNGDKDGALEDFNKAISLNPNYAAPYNGQGNILADRGKLNDALNSFNSAIKLDANPIAAYSGRADVWFQKGELDKALDDYNKFIELKQNTAGERIRRGIVYGLKRNWKLSFEDLSKGIEINSRPKSPLSGNIKVALEDLDKFITQYPEIAGAYAVRGLIKLLEGKEIEAKKDFEKGFNLDAELNDQVSPFIKTIKEKQGAK